MAGRNSQSTASRELEETILLAARGDRDAQQRLLEQYWAVIRQAVRGRRNRLGPRLEAREETRDLEQAAALKLLTELDRHTWRGRSAFAAWVKKLAKHGVIDTYRHHRAKKRDVATEVAALDLEQARVPLRSAESRVDAQNRFRALMAELQELKPEYGAALLMHHLGFSHAEIGDTLGCSAEAARKLVSRARTKLLAVRRG